METAATESQQGTSSGSSLNWGGLGQGAMPLGMPLGAGLGAGLGAAEGAKDEQKEVGKKASGKNGEAAAQGVVADQQKKEEPPPTREQLMQDPAKYGMPKGMSPAEYANQYADEYLAKLSYKDPNAVAGDPKAKADGYSKGDQDFLKGWGYKFPPQEVKDDKTGLYVAKFEPTSPKSGIAPVIAFRGTEGGSPDKREVAKDVQADLSYSYIGQNQYESKKDEIGKLFKEPNGQKVDVTGHSLGGALAQKAVVDNIASTRALTTFQAPGILQTDADKFAKENKQYGVDVNHHYVTTDLVHRAGEAKLAGNFWEHTVPGAVGPDQLGGITMPHSMADLRKDASLGGDIGKGIVDSHTRHDLLSNKDQTITEHSSDPQKDRGMWEGLRKQAGQRINSTHIFDALQDGLNAKADIDNAKSAWGAGTAGAKTALGQGVAGAKADAKEAGTGFSDLAHLNVKKGLGEIGHGIGGGISDLVGGGWGAAKSLFGGAKNAGSELVHAGGDAAKTVKDVATGIPGMASLAKEGFGALKSHGSQIMGSVKDVAVDEIHQLEKGKAGQLIHGVENTITHGGAAAKDIVGAGAALKGGITGAASAAGTGFQGAVSGAKQAGSGVSELAHLDVKKGLSDIGGGVSNGVSSVAHAGAGMASSMWQGAKGAASEVGGALGEAKKVGGGLVDSAKGLFNLFGHHSK